MPSPENQTKMPFYNPHLPPHHDALASAQLAHFDYRTTLTFRQIEAIGNQLRALREELTIKRVMRWNRINVMAGIEAEEGLRREDSLYSSFKELKDWDSTSWPTASSPLKIGFSHRDSLDFRTGYDQTVARELLMDESVSDTTSMSQDTGIQGSPIIFF